MTRITYEIVEHDGVGDVFPSHDAARRAAERAAHEDDPLLLSFPPCKASASETSTGSGVFYGTRFSSHILKNPARRMAGAAL
jgi:hypothetical protein